MKKITKQIGRLAACCFLLSVIFKAFHLMGAPSLFLLSIIFGGGFFIALVFNRFKKK